MGDDTFNELSARISHIESWLSDADVFIEQNNLDRRIFAGGWGGDLFLRLYHQIVAPNRDLINKIRHMWWFSGWPILAYADRNTFPILDPTYIRYKKLKPFTPIRFRYVAPPVMGEVGWRENAGIVNHDVAITQERLQFLYFCGVTDYLDEFKKPLVLEMASGNGAMARAFCGAFEKATYILCDIPQTLPIAFCYLNVTNPDANHFIVTKDGVKQVSHPKRQIPFEKAIEQPGFIYLPTYLLPKYEKLLDCHMVYNAMSLHEMGSDIISYYCKIVPQFIKNNHGIFFEVNTIPGVENAMIDPPLKNRFSLPSLDWKFESLGLYPRIWTQSEETLNQIKGAHKRKCASLPLKELFQFDFYYEYPVFNDKFVFKKVVESLGPGFGEGCNPEREGFVGNHLRAHIRKFFGR